MQILSFFALPSLLACGVAAVPSQQQAELAFDALQGWYNESIGLWIPSTGWWNSANCLTVIADLAEINPDVATKAEAIYPNTWSNAQDYNLQLQKTVAAPEFLMQSQHGGNLPKHKTTGFLNNYYDDEGQWNGLVLIALNSDLYRLVGIGLDRCIRCDRRQEVPPDC